MTTPLEILKGAKDLLDGGKAWVQNEYHATINGVEHYCAIAAVNASAFGEPMGPRFGVAEDQEKIEVRNIASVVLAKAMGRYDDAYGSNQTGNVIEFNDLKGRTASEVLAAFDRAIAALEGEH